MCNSKFGVSFDVMKLKIENLRFNFMLWIVKFKIEVLIDIMFSLKLQCDVFILRYKVEIEI
jgi:hypothetical protein